MDNFEILKSLIQRVNNLPLGNVGELDDIKRKARMALENLMPTKLYWTEIDIIRFENIYVGNVAPQVRINDWENGRRQLFNLLDTAIQDYELILKQKRQQIQTPIIKERIIQVQDHSKITEIKNEFIGYKQTVKEWTIFSVLLLLLSTGIWITYFNASWDWFENHENKISITFLFNLTIIAVLLNIPLRSKWLIWIPIIFGILTTLFSIL